ncbi:hypothetical protein MINTM005_13910 [Mycobacterium intracellulare]|nr:hypothetical protein MINTM005_13910 [Mycobacterium intracellulare]
MKERKTFWAVHTGTPAEPWGKDRERGRVLVARPGKGNLPAQALIEWRADDKDERYSTWESCSDLVLAGEHSWEEVRKCLREKDDKKR